MAADLVVIVALGSDVHRAACVCRAWFDALGDVPRLTYDPRGRAPMLDAARACAKNYDACLQTPEFINLLRGCTLDMKERPWKVAWHRALRVPNAWTLRGHLRWLPHRQVNRALRAALCGLPYTIPIPDRAARHRSGDPEKGTKEC